MAYILTLLILGIGAAAVAWGRPPLALRWFAALAPFVLVIFVVDGEWWFIVPLLVLLTSHWRLLLQRYGHKRERRITLRTATYLLFGLAVMAAIETLATLIDSDWFAITAALLLLVFSVRAFVLTVLRTGSQHISIRKDVEYPTVTLAIPARNETHALTDTLRAALASDYPKLEILVLDDCSQDSTPDIIRSFAHDGVRFIQGKEPASGWIGKNRAYEHLLNEASGDLVLFAGVDVRMQPGSVRQLVHAFIGRRLELLSIMPQRRHFDIFPNMLRPLRYYWQLAFAPWPFISSCWLVDRTWLLKQGGFNSVKHDIRPERTLAIKARKEQAYGFLLSSGEHGVSTRKKLQSLYQTAIRTAYPIHKKEPVLVYSSNIVLISVLVLCAMAWLSEPRGVEVLFARLSSLLLLASYAASEMSQQGLSGFVSALFAPLAALSESAASLLSMIQYESGKVDWKGRNVCLPVMLQRPRERG